MSEEIVVDELVLKDIEANKEKKDKEDKTKKVSNKEKKQKRFKKRLKQLILKTVILIVGIILLTTVFFSVNLVHGNDMYPSLRDGDLVISYRLANIYMSDHVFLYRHDGVKYFGRIVGVAGDRIEMTSDGCYKINGSVPYEDQFYDTLPSTSGAVTYPYTVPENSVFILSDYRLQSNDSRVFGAIPTKDLIGEVVLVFRRRGF